MDSFKEMDNNKKIGIIVIVAIVLVGGFLLLRNILDSSSSGNSNSAISGTFDVNGVLPDGSTITISKAEYDDGDKAADLESSVAAEDIPAEDGSSWTISNLDSGTTYVITADLMSEGETISSSNHLVVTAPASGEVLTFNIETINGEANAEVSGTIVVNGFIPEGSTITTEGRVAGTSTFSVLAEGIAAKPVQTRSTDQAIAGESYDVVGVLYNASGQRIGQSDILVVTAPAKNEVLVINSSATPPAGGGTSPAPEEGNDKISGTINFNGVAPADSRIVILQRENGQSDYQVAVDNVEPVDGATWTWDGAKHSVWYDIQAVLKQKQSNNTDKDIAESHPQSIAAPAEGVTLSINSGVSNPAPTKQVSMQCGSQSGDVWNATLTLPRVDGAQTYWYQVGTSNGGNDKANTTVAADGNNDVQVSIQLENVKTFYFRYAYANVPDVGTGNSQFSPFSSTSQGSCGA